MISLKKYIESHTEQLLAELVANYRAALMAFANGGYQVCPNLGADFQESLMRLRDRLSSTATPKAVRETESGVEDAVRHWSRSASDYINKTTEEVRDIVKTVASSAQTLADRDQRYAGELTQISRKLEVAAELEDLHQMRQSLADSVRGVNASVEQMVREGEQSVAILRAEVATYQTRLAAAEHLASVDPLTGLDNRRSVMRQLEQRADKGRPFLVISIDLNNFKPVNDRYGHIAGDSILRQFSAELKDLFRPSDTVGRIGGDEFIVAVEGAGKESAALVGRIKQWVYGDYSIQFNGQRHQVHIDAASGCALWHPGDEVIDVLARADADMYQSKRSRRAS